MLHSCTACVSNTVGIVDQMFGKVKRTNAGGCDYFWCKNQTGTPVSGKELLLSYAKIKHTRRSKYD